MGAADFIVATVAEKVPGLHDQLIQDVSLLRRLNEKGRILLNRGGDGFEIRVRKARTGLVRAISDLSSGQARSADCWQTLTGSYRAYGAEIALSRLQLKRNEAAGQEAKVIELLEEEMAGVEQDFESYLAEDMNGDGTAGTGDEGTPIEGLQSIVSASNTHFGVDRSAAANSWWRANVSAVTNDFNDDDNADGVTNGLDALLSAWLTCGGGVAGDGKVSPKLATRKSRPDLIYTTQTTFGNILRSLVPQQRYTSDRKSVNEDVSLFGLPVDYDPYAVADSAFILTLSALQYRVIGPKLIYRDAEDELGLGGAPRVTAVGLVHQGQFYPTRPALQARVTNTD